ncbi:MAG: hypothetical protein IKB01_01450 [Lachnospiraceae bacterium]|nr:hypothetical protein [Lachnospiraceae bacterium]
MSVDIMQTISIVAFVLAGIFAVVALILWFTLNVRGIIDDLSGKKAERQIRELREQNVQSQMADRKNRVVYTNPTEKNTSKLGFDKKKESTSQLTVPLPKREASPAYRDMEQTALLQEEGTTLLEDENGTVVLEMEEGTTVLEVEEGTTVLGTEEGTTVLGDEEGTTVLAQEVPMLQNGYQLVLNEIVIHTKERIA